MTGGSYFFEMLRMLLALAGVCLLAWVVLKLLAQRGFGKLPVSSHVTVIDRVELSPRRSLYLIEVEGRRLLLGVGEGDSPRLITELRDSGPSAEPEAPSDG